MARTPRAKPPVRQIDPEPNADGSVVVDTSALPADDAAGEEDGEQQETQQPNGHDQDEGVESLRSQLQEANARAAVKVKKAVDKSVRVLKTGSAPTSSSNATLTKAMQQLRRTGSEDDTVAAFAASF